MARVLVVDDDDLLVELVEHTLVLKGFDVVKAEDGIDALEQIKTEKPDAVVLDGMMPGADGIEVLRELKGNEGSDTIPVVMLSARKEQSDVVGSLQLGADDYLIKPFIPDELVLRLERVLR